MNEFKRARAALKATLTHFATYVGSAQDLCGNLEVIVEPAKIVLSLQRRLDSSESLLTEYKEIHANITAIDDDDDHEIQLAQFENDFFDIMTDAEILIGKIKSTCEQSECKAGSDFIIEQASDGTISAYLIVSMKSYESAKNAHFMTSLSRSTHSERSMLSSSAQNFDSAGMALSIGGLPQSTHSERYVSSKPQAYNKKQMLLPLVPPVQNFDSAGRTVSIGGVPRSTHSERFVSSKPQTESEQTDSELSCNKKQMLLPLVPPVQNFDPAGRTVSIGGVPRSTYSERFVSSKSQALFCNKKQMLLPLVPVQNFDPAVRTVSTDGVSRSTHSERSVSSKSLSESKQTICCSEKQILLPIVPAQNFDSAVRTVSTGGVSRSTQSKRSVSPEPEVEPQYELSVICQNDIQILPPIIPVQNSDTAGKMDLMSDIPRSTHPERFVSSKGQVEPSQTIEVQILLPNDSAQIFDPAGSSTSIKNFMDSGSQSNFSFLNLDKITGNIPSCQVDQDITPSNLHLSDLLVNQPEQIILGPGHLRLQKIFFVCVMAGRIKAPSTIIFRCRFNRPGEVPDQLVRFWELESCPTKRAFSKEEYSCEAHFKQTRPPEVLDYFREVAFKDSFL